MRKFTNYLYLDLSVLDSVFFEDEEWENISTSCYNSKSFPDSYNTFCRSSHTPITCTFATIIHA